MFARVRPLLPFEKKRPGCKSCVTFEYPNSVTARDEGKQCARTLEFDRVFGPESGNDQVFFALFVCLFCDSLIMANK